MAKSFDELADIYDKVLKEALLWLPPIAEATSNICTIIVPHPDNKWPEQKVSADLTTTTTECEVFNVVFEREIINNVAIGWKLVQR